MHFTYNDNPDLKCLKQGDVIRKTDIIEKLFNKVHPYYASNEEYTHFMVITQSCDLVLDGRDKCRTSIINLVGIKPLSVLIDTIINRYRRNSEFLIHSKTCSRKNHKEFINFLERLYNNNEQDFFFLYKEPETEFLIDSCAYLRIAIPFRAIDYDNILSAKVLELNEVFQAKLGWMVGKIYNRIGTKDWVPTIHGDRKSFIDMLINLADQTTNWLDDSQINKIKKIWEKNGRNIETAEQLVFKEIESMPILTKKQRCVNEIIDKLLDEKIISKRFIHNVEEILYSVSDIKNMQ